MSDDLELSRINPHDWPSGDAEPLAVDETEDNDYPTPDDIKEAQTNYDNAPPSIKLYIDALSRKFPS